MTRTFIAVELDSAVRTRAEELVRILRSADADVKWVEPQNLHITLQFLGEIPDGLIADTCKAVEKGAAQMRAFDLDIGEAGAFPNSSRPRTLWIGAKSGADRMAELHDYVALELSALGFQDDGRQFQTHLTVGRTRCGKNVPNWANCSNNIPIFRPGG